MMMRSWILIGAAASALSACGGGQPADNAAESEGNATSQLVATNDTTAIDAATGEAAAMAADVEFMPGLDEAAGNGGDGNRAQPSARPQPTAARPARRETPAAPTPAESPEPDPPESPASNAL